MKLYPEKCTSSLSSIETNNFLNKAYRPNAHLLDILI